ncbi:MAG: efflux RND transporter periplasmic adaptor subunit [Alphaproteobacteria bacterium]
MTLTELREKIRWPKGLRLRWPRFRRTREFLRRQPPQRRAMIIMLVVVGILFGGVIGWQMFMRAMMTMFMASGFLPPQTVSTVVVDYQTWQPRIEAVGSLRAVNGADLSLELPGIVEEIAFNSGDDVEAGKVLLRLRAGDDIGRLQALEAAAELAAANYARDQRQFQIRAISKAALDASAANLKSAQAQVEEARANLNKKVITAPFAGHLGIRQVNVGQFVPAGTVVVTLQSLDPIYLDFFLPQQELNRIKTNQKVVARVDTYPNQRFEGVISGIDPKVDPATRNVAVRATLYNPEHKLLPGMYGTVEIEAGKSARYLTLPQTAITFNPYGTTVYIAEQKGTKDKPQLVARQTFVTTGQTRGDQIQVISGVKKGDVVVSAGQLKLQNGTPLIVNNTIQPKNDPRPTPTEY